MNREEKITNKLSVLKPHYLNVTNQSNLHFGHAGHNGGSDTHYLIEISADIFNDKSRIQQHKMINNLLKDEFHQGLHALSIKIMENNLRPSGVLDSKSH